MSKISDNASGKSFGKWICSNCGFYVTTADTMEGNPMKDMKTGFDYDLRNKIKKWREEYNT